MDFLRDFGGAITAILGGVMAGVTAWVKGISTRVQETSTRVAVLEDNQSKVPDLLREIKDEIAGMRTDARQSNKDLYAHIDSFRREVKADLQGKVDKA